MASIGRNDASRGDLPLIPMKGAGSTGLDASARGGGYDSAEPCAAPLIITEEQIADIFAAIRRALIAIG
ncbi:hypothetical protein [Bradyrhizobium sp. OK095]|uniref:hypothetical protein n=1 Tax=Bradyrhizobium sp. OK095 TaxID=1882760 RepID=UPI00115FBF45|nr:hypothetical protein [Bradyrhizobium sp. OK095]